MGRKQAAAPGPELQHRGVARVIALAVLTSSLIVALVSTGRSVAAAGSNGDTTTLDTLAHCLSCGDKPTPDGFPCELQERWGKCQESWMVSADYCSLTCGRCCQGVGPGKQKSHAQAPPPTHGKFDANEDSNGDMIVILHGVGLGQGKAGNASAADPATLKGPFSSPPSKPAVLPTAAPGSPPPSPPKHKPHPAHSPASQGTTERMLQQPLGSNDSPGARPRPSARSAATTAGNSTSGPNSQSATSSNASSAPSDSASPSSPVGAEGSAAATAEPDPLDQRYECDGRINIHQVLQAQAQVLRLGVFVEALHWAGLEDSFNQPNAQATVLIPIDSAWQRLATDLGSTVADLLSNTTALRAILLYHLIPQSLSPAALQRTPVIPTYWKGHDLYGTFSSDTLMLGAGSGRNAHVLQKLQVCHSFLYTLDRVLLPTTQQLSSLPQLTEYNPNDRTNQSTACIAPATALAALKADADLSTTASVLMLLGLSDKLGSATHNLTLLAPSNAAWDNFALGLNTSTSALLRNTSMRSSLSSIAEFHLVPQSLTCGESLCEGSYATLNSHGGPLYVHNLRSSKSSVQSLTSTALVVPASANSCLGNKFLIKIDAVLQPGPNSAPRN